MAFLGILIAFFAACESSENSQNTQNSQISNPKNKEQAMENPQDSTLKLIFPQWQGGDIAAWFKDLKPENAAKGYILGAQILNLLADSINENLAKNEAIVPISQDFQSQKDGTRLVQDGIIDKNILQTQNLEALRILNERKATRVLTLGGECATSIAPFTYLAAAIQR